MYGCHARCHGSYLSLLLLDLVLVLPVVEGLQQHLGSILVSSQRVLRMRAVALHIYRTEPQVLSVFQSFRCCLNLEPDQLGETCIPVLLIIGIHNMPYRYLHLYYFIHRIR